jgi:hypothetical protein
MDRAMDQAHALAAISAASLGSLVDFAEALSIILAIGIIRGWMAAWVRAGAGLTAQAIIVAGLCPAMAAAPIHPLPFGMRWLRRAMLRAGAVIRMHAETRSMPARPRGCPRPGWCGAQGSIRWARSPRSRPCCSRGSRPRSSSPQSGLPGDVAARQPGRAEGLRAGSGGRADRPCSLARAPEVSLKLSAGVMISAFGIFWLGEGMGLRWPGEDLAPSGLIGALGLAAAPSGRMVRRIAAQEGGGA